ncbi:hypothetical protein ACFWNR_01905 [Streptomyces virginiae]|uniref:hypothetical protein n=1 Tax=Streptomyces virginiae TaxID=1961 RepID=UPI003652ED07
MAESDKGAAAVPSSLTSAADRIREASKWLIVSFAAVGVTLFGGLQLADLGELSGDQEGRWIPAVLGVALGLGGLALAIFGASSVVTESYASLGWLSEDENSEIRLELERDPTLLGGFDSIEILAREIHAAQKRRNEAYAARYQSVGAGASTARIEAANEEVRSASHSLEALSQVEQRILRDASLKRVAKAYEKSRSRMFVGAGIAALGIASFAWGANPPDRPKTVEAEQILPPSPSDVTVVIGEGGGRRNLPSGKSLQEALGVNCDISNVAAIALAAAGDTYDLVSIKTDRCNPVYFTVGPSQGRIVPRAVEEKDAKAAAEPARPQG